MNNDNPLGCVRGCLTCALPLSIALWLLICGAIYGLILLGHAVGG